MANTAGHINVELDVVLRNRRTLGEIVAGTVTIQVPVTLAGAAPGADKADES